MSEQDRYPDDRSAVDFGRRSDDYAEHRPGFPPSFFDRLEQHLPLDGIRAVDLGTGPAIVATDLAQRGAQVTGVDVSADQIESGRRRVETLGLTERCTLVNAPAEHTGLASQCAQLVTAGQCWGWFDQDAAFAEVRRLLQPGGLLVIGQYCYLPRHSPVAAASETLILEINPGWSMSGFDGIYPQRIDAVIEGGFELVEQVCWDHVQPFSHDAWRGRMRTCNGVGSGAMSAEQVAEYDARLTDLLREQFPDEPLHVPHRIWLVVGRRP